MTSRRSVDGASDALRIGVDIGGTSIAALLLDGDRVVGEATVASARGGDPLLRSTAALVRRLVDAAGCRLEDVASVGVGVPGIVDAATGRVANAVNLGVESWELGAELSRALGVPVHVDNDVNAAALAAAQLVPAASIAYLNIGTGLAAAAVVDGRLQRGSRGAAGEIGHIVVEPQGRLCPCGQRGCLETVVSGRAVASDWVADGPATVSALFAAADAGDVSAGAVADRFLGGVMQAVRLLLLTLDVELVAVAGGAAQGVPDLLGRVRGRDEADSRASALLASLALPARVRLLTDEHRLATRGAAALGLLQAG